MLGATNATLLLVKACEGKNPLFLQLLQGRLLNKKNIQGLLRQDENRIRTLGGQLSHYLTFSDSLELLDSLISWIRHSFLEVD